MMVLQTLDIIAFLVTVLANVQDEGTSGREKDEAVRQLLAADDFVIDDIFKSMKTGARNDWMVNTSLKSLRLRSHSICLE